MGEQRFVSPSFPQYETVDEESLLPWNAYS